MEDSTPISIAIPVYNSAKFLEKCLDSILDQTYKNLEIVVLNNSSTDDSLDIISRYQEKDARIKCYTIPHVPTETWSRNNAYIRTTAEWVIPVDSDDAIEPEYVEKLWKRHMETGAEWVGATMTFVDDNDKIVGRIPKDYFDYSQVLDGKDAVILTLKGWQINGNGALIHRSLVPCIASGEARPLYNVEYDTRIILYHAKTVAFVDAKYFFGYNPNSFGRKPSYSKVTYVLQAFTGLLPFVQQNYDLDSEEVKVTSSTCASMLVPAFIVYLQNKKSFTVEQRCEYKTMCKSLYDNLLFSRVKDSAIEKTLKMVVTWVNMILFKIA